MYETEGRRCLLVPGRHFETFPLSPTNTFPAGAASAAVTLPSLLGELDSRRIVQSVREEGIETLV